MDFIPNITIFAQLGKKLFLKVANCSEGLQHLLQLKIALNSPDLDRYLIMEAKQDQPWQKLGWETSLEYRKLGDGGRLHSATFLKILQSPQQGSVTRSHSEFQVHTFFLPLIYIKIQTQNV